MFEQYHVMHFTPYTTYSIFFFLDKAPQISFKKFFSALFQL